ncbi:hypothetical protein C343_05147 [Cryptococcus neoformans C23]|uniref:PWWP domain-containing protein n=1 Tax=Cryptococcus neoformans (strain H99 / ATCC 208821 / CBS 10515 / FGSC 9487) TaxID=235443 RepID=J9VZ55_CRYN9|nr:hypothetical protein CNAG_04284 [Cryptococcus neoformans var. grubii H99]AFR97015.1 hypothetical protein CNAG_04284 [Cryptococcus neoformans var. grubii H99]AUB26991.1 hypothetical protein CKF44_04284 [Cryptococcus neoformans var. grubii]OWZ41187.1 hypothetical protein C343_05147 [Cryptococcus neoformans var. grubii C23]|eukprot:XP_012051708.1 hypothetical protein CNAG_04284 [Cryptococcus neoformans var. grubii H99]
MSSSPLRDDKPAAKKSAAKSRPASKPAPAEHKFEIGDIVLARLRGYPPWPARIANPETLPRNVLKTRPGKNPNLYCCQFFPAGDFSWLQNKDIKALSSSDISAFLSQSHRKASGGLREAYQTAQDPTEWDAQQEEIHKQQEEAEANVDELEDEDEAEVVVKAGKRKRDEPKKKKAAAAKKEEEPKSKKAKAAAASKAGDKKKTVSKAEGDEDPLASNPECVKVKDWRHKLQKAFLGESMPAESEMPHWNEVFESIETYDSMTIEALQYSKIGKVMKKIMGLTTIPLNDKYEFTKRAGKLMHQWQEFIDAANRGPVTNGQKKSARPSATTTTAAVAAAEETPASPTKEDKPVDETPARTESAPPAEENKEESAAEPVTDEKMELDEKKKEEEPAAEKADEPAAAPEKTEEEAKAKTPEPEPEPESAEKPEANGEDKMQVDA